MVAIRRSYLETQPPGSPSSPAGTRQEVGFMPRARRDSLPEHTPYQDTGCEVYRSCLSCPLARCIYDEPGGARRLLAGQRDRSIVLMQRRGANVNSIARRFGVSRRTVFRALARERDAKTGGNL